MFSTGCFRRSGAAAVALLLAASAAAQPGPAGATLFRVFLTDGSTVVSYGEYARVADRIVFSLPIGGTLASPELQLLSLPSASVDWDKTETYAESARATRYAQTRGPEDFALLNEGVSRALSDIAVTPDPARKVEMAAEARLNVTRWAAEHYGYRAQNVAELAGLFDSVVAETRSAEGLPNFDLSLVANMAAPPAVPLMPMPTDRERVEEGMRVAALVADGSERISLLQAIQKVLAKTDPHAAWAEPIRLRVREKLAVEAHIDTSYTRLAHDSFRQADRYMRSADVNGVERVIAKALEQDSQLGQRRPGEMASVLAGLDDKLEGARRLRLARDHFASRLADLRAYDRAITTTLGVLRTSRAELDQIRRLAGPWEWRTRRLASRLAEAKSQLATITPPAEAAAVHALFRTAIQVAEQAAQLRLRAIAADDMQLARDASAASAGALLLLERASQDLKVVLTPPSTDTVAGTGGSKGR